MRLRFPSPRVGDVELSLRHEDRPGAITGHGEPMLLKLPVVKLLLMLVMTSALAPLAVSPQ